MKEDVTGWKILNLCKLWSSATIIGAKRNAYPILMRDLKGRDHLGDLSVDGRIILKWILGKQDMD
jgi:hypothetical protein